MSLSNQLLEALNSAKERERAELYVVAEMFYNYGWEDRARYDDEIQASKASKVLREHKNKYHKKTKHVSVKKIKLA